MKVKYLLAILFTLCIIIAPPLYSFASQTGSSHPEKEEDDVLEAMDDMTLEEKIGQLFIVHVYGQTPEDANYEEINLTNDRGGKNFKEVIENYHVGGIIYFNWTDNIGIPVDPAQVNELSNGLQEIAMEQSSAIPLFISTDQEGGTVQRVQEPGTVFPGNMAIGATESEKYAEKSGQVIGNELYSLGINMNFAPTVDVNMNPANPVIGVRSFGEDPDLVSQLGVAQIQGYGQENVMASGKHFPGHGDTDVDSHYGLPVIDHDLETLEEIDLKPFNAAIEDEIESIMTAHIVVPALDDSELPATLSKPILTDLLREDMNFEGLIITDSLGMSGANVYPPDRVAVEAFQAGADLLLNPPNVEVAFDGMLEAVESGEISMERLDESVYRILSSKMDHELFENPYVDEGAIDSIGSEEHLQVAQSIANRGITLVKNEEEVLPLDPSEKVLVVGPSDANPDNLTDYLIEKETEDATYLETDTSPTNEQISVALEQAEDADKVIVTTYTANTNEEQQQLVEQLKANGSTVIVTAMHHPYDLLAFPEVDAYVNAYGNLDVSVKAVADTLIGDLNPKGTLPVSLPELHDRGHGLGYMETELSAEGMMDMVNFLADEGAITDESAQRTLTMHLTAVNQYEEKGLPEKVLKHLASFHKLLDEQLEKELISEKAYNYLNVDAERLDEFWSTQ